MKLFHVERFGYGASRFHVERSGRPGKLFHVKRRSSRAC